MALALPTRQRQASSFTRRETRAGLLFILPWIISLLIFTAYPVFGTLGLSFTEYNIIKPPEFIGLDNFQQMFFEDPAYWVAVRNTLIYAGAAVILRLVFSLALALVLNMGVRGISIYRVIFYLPALVPPVVAAIVFLLMFNYANGPINNVIGAVGLQPPDWLRDPAWSKPALIILGLWPLGIEVLVFLAGLKAIPQDLLDAASVDGASPIRRLFGVTIPLLTPVILFNLVTGVIYSFQVFAQALVIGDTTGKPLESTLMYMVLVYRNAFRYFSMGYAAAQSLILFIVVALLTLLVFRTSRRWVYYEGGDR
jgi:multiple sugar transport system permease protein